MRPNSPLIGIALLLGPPKLKRFWVRNPAPVASVVRVCLNDLKYKAVGAGVPEENEGAATGPEGAGVEPVATTMALGGAG